jgi:hypothetical protein
MASNNREKNDIMTISTWFKIFKMGQYGFLTRFSGLTNEEARALINNMVDVYNIMDFQFYDTFYSYSQPMKQGETEWETKASSIINKNQHMVDANIVRVYIDQIKLRGGRSWLYIQSVAADEDGLHGYQRLQHTHMVCDTPLFNCYWPDRNWARRMCDIWVPFALYFKFSGIHWDSLGPCGSVFGRGDIFSTFLRATSVILKTFGLLQTFNFVDGFAWDPALVTEKVLEFPYWEVWTLPAVEDAFFSETKRFNESVFVCYPCGQHNPPLIDPRDLVSARFNKCLAEGCRYLVIGDGSMMIQTEYFPNTKEI